MSDPPRFRDIKKSRRLALVVAVLGGALVAIQLTSSWAGAIVSGPSASSAAVSSTIPRETGGVRLTLPIPSVTLATTSPRSSTPAAKVSPPARSGAAMTFDAKDGYVLLFGGLNQSQVFNDTWKFAAGVWTKLSPAHSPPPNYLTGMTYDAKSRYVVLLDGNQTWKYSGGAWTRLSPLRTPPTRYASTMTYDAKDGYVLLFGGVSPSGFLYDTWKFAGGQWTNITKAAHPPARAFMAMTYDAKDGYVVLFGGCHIGGACTTGDFLADTWTFHGGKWTQLTTTSQPSARAGEMLTYDAADGYVVLFAGCDTSNCSSPYADTWTFVGGVWAQLTPSSHPGARLIGAMVFDSKTKYVVLIGGAGPLFTVLGDTWKFTAGNWTKI
jgi:Galactose oxidase, central domain